MNKLLDFGRKAMFYVRVISGYEERRLRTYRLEMEKRILEAEAKKAAIRRIPEKLILSEVRQMVEEMQSLNKKLEETEAAIEDYFKPLDKEAELIVKTQLNSEEKRMKQMMQAMQVQSLLEKAGAEKNAETVERVEESPSSSMPVSGYNTTSSIGINELAVGGELPRRVFC